MTPFGLSGSSQAKATLCLVISLAWINAIGDGAARKKKKKKKKDISNNLVLIRHSITYALSEIVFFLCGG